VPLLVECEFDKGVGEISETVPTCATAGFKELCERHAGLGTAALPRENGYVVAQRDLKRTAAPATLGIDRLASLW
jgi:hypothetical protein